jgi:hypothetical protein
MMGADRTELGTVIAFPRPPVTDEEVCARTGEVFIAMGNALLGLLGDARRHNDRIAVDVITDEVKRLYKLAESDGTELL